MFIKNILYNKLIVNCKNKLFTHGKKNYFLKLFYTSFKKLKYIYKLNPSIFLLWVLHKLRPFFNVVRFVIKHKKKKKKITLKPQRVNYRQSCNLSSSWFLINMSFKYKYIKYNYLLERCFLCFLDKKQKNYALNKKKIIYTKIICYKRFFRY